jgi:hypothetical protein
VDAHGRLETPLPNATRCYNNLNITPSNKRHTVPSRLARPPTAELVLRFYEASNWHVASLVD